MFVGLIADSDDQVDQWISGSGLTVTKRHRNRFYLDTGKTVIISRNDYTSIMNTFCGTELTTWYNLSEGTMEERSVLYLKSRVRRFSCQH